MSTCPSQYLYAKVYNHMFNCVGLAGSKSKAVSARGVCTKLIIHTGFASAYGISIWDP